MADIVLVAACALVDVDNRVLVAQRPGHKSFGGLWEFPGGKIEPDETPETCLIRELHEELGITTWESCLAPLTFASHPYDRFHLLMPLYICRRWEGNAAAREHEAIRWVRPNRLRELEMPPADAPLIPALIDLL
jgi:8-oxo-dGTP diphosphatase